MKKIFTLFLVLGGMFVFAYSASAATLNVNGATGNDVTGTPYKTIQAAYDAANAGDTIVVAAGVYENDLYDVNKSITLRGAKAGTVANGSNRGVETIIKRFGTYGFEISASNVVIDGFYFGDPTVTQHLAGNGRRVKVGSGASNVQILNNSFHYTYTNSIVVDVASNVTISGNFAENSYYSCIVIKNASNVTLDNNKLKDCGDIGGATNVEKAGIYIENTSPSTITGNTLESNGVGIYFKALNLDTVTYSGNIFTANTTNVITDGCTGTLAGTIPAPIIHEGAQLVGVAGATLTMNAENVVTGFTLRAGLNPVTVTGFTDSAIDVITFTIPSIGAGEYNLTLTNPDNQLDTWINGLRVNTSGGGTEYAAPTITLTTQLSGKPNDELNITGTGFRSGIVVNVGSTPAVVKSYSETSLVFVVPNVATGVYNLEVRNSDGKYAQFVNGLSVTNTNTGGTTTGGGGGGGAVIIGSDNKPKSASIIINNGDKITKSRDVQLKLAAGNMTYEFNPTFMMVSNQSTLGNALWVSFRDTYPWQLTNNEGAKTVYVKFKNSQGESEIVSDAIIYDIDGIVSGVGSVINNGVVAGDKITDRDAQLQMILDDAHYIWPGDTNLLLNYMGLNRSLETEVNAYNKYTTLLTDKLPALENFNKIAVTNFTGYSTKTTLPLGAGERAGVLNSYKSAFGELPKTEEDWRDAIKIANGRWPNERNTVAEARAKETFKKVYLRNANMNQQNDNAAVTVMAYGLRPSDRNLNSEKAGIKIFRDIYGYTPVSATDWDTVRAIAYSGATRIPEQNQVSGVKIYADGTLLRTPDYKTYIVENGKKRAISGPAELQNYTGREIINVSFDIVAGFDTATPVVATKIYKNGDLLKGSNHNIYVIKDGQKVMLLTLEQFLPYAGQDIYTVTDAELAKY